MLKIRLLALFLVTLSVFFGCSSPVEEGPIAKTPIDPSLTVPLNTKTTNMIIFGDDIATEVVAGYPGLTGFAGSEPEFRVLINANLNPIKNPAKLLDYSKPINVTYLENMEAGMLVDQNGEGSKPDDAPSWIQYLRTMAANGKKEIMAVKEKVDYVFAKGKEIRQNWEKAVEIGSTIGVVKDFFNNNKEFVSYWSDVAKKVSDVFAPLTDLVSFIGDVSKFLGPAGAVVDTIFGIVDYFFKTSGPPGATPEANYILEEMQKQFDLVFEKLEGLQTSVNKIDDYLKTFSYNLANKDYMTHFNVFEGSRSQLSSYLSNLDGSHSTVVNKAMDIDGDFRSRVNTFLSVAMEKQAAYLAKIKDYTGGDAFFIKEKKDHFDNFVYTIENPVHIKQATTYLGSGSTTFDNILSTQNFSETITMRNPKPYLPMDQDTLDYLTQVIAYNFYIESFLANGESNSLRGLQSDLAKHYLSNFGSIKALKDMVNAVYESAQADLAALLSQVDASEINMKYKLTGLPSYQVGTNQIWPTGVNNNSNTIMNCLFFPPETYSFRGLTFYRKSNNSQLFQSTLPGYYPQTLMNEFGLKWTNRYPSSDGIKALGDIYPDIGLAKIKGPTGTYILDPMTVSGNSTAFWTMVREFMKKDFKTRMNNTVLPLASILAAQEVILKTYIPR